MRSQRAASLAALDKPWSLIAVGGPDEATVIVGVPYSRIAHYRRYSVLNTPGLTMQVTP